MFTWSIRAPILGTRPSDTTRAISLTVAFVLGRELTPPVIVTRVLPRQSAIKPRPPVLICLLPPIFSPDVKSHEEGKPQLDRDRHGGVTRGSPAHVVER